MNIIRMRDWLAISGVFAFSGPVVGADVSGSADFPEIGRFEGSEIASYSVENYDATTFATGPVLKASDAELTTLTVEGKVTRIVYKVVGGSSALEVFRNFENRVAEAGFTTVFSGGPNQINDYNFKYKHPVEKLNEISLSGEIWYVAAKQSAGGADTYISVLVSPHSGGDGQRVRLIGVTTKAMENRMLDAEKMAAGIAESGKIALYGIFFDTDKADVKESSKPTLDEIGKLLHGDRDMRTIVVGHTDSQGSNEYNMDLSNRRASAVVEILRKEYKVESERIRSAGVGYLAPAASNDSVAGRELNRRVELVKDK